VPFGDGEGAGIKMKVNQVKAVLYGIDAEGTEYFSVSSRPLVVFLRIFSALSYASIPAAEDHTVDTCIVSLLICSCILAPSRAAAA
jgi:hypothetical protein